MKRDEMIKAIATEIILNIHMVPWNVAQQQAEVILNRIEAEGMKPPVYTKDTWVDSKDGYTIFTDKFNEWESEDE